MTMLLFRMIDAQIMQSQADDTIAENDVVAALADETLAENGVVAALADETFDYNDLATELGHMAVKVDRVWLSELGLRISDKCVLESDKEWLNDRIIAAGQKLLQAEFPHLQGFKDPLMVAALRCQLKGTTFVQIIYNGNNHWLTVTNTNSIAGTVKVYDSLQMLPTFDVKQQVAALSATSQKSLVIQVMNVEKQWGGSDCGLLSLAYTTSICYGIDPVNVAYEQKALRRHLLGCFAQHKMTLFPVQSCRTVRRMIVFTLTERVYCCCRHIRRKGQDVIECSGARNGSIQDVSGCRTGVFRRRLRISSCLLSVQVVLPAVEALISN
jgi:hypothetical protein